MGMRTSVHRGIHTPPSVAVVSTYPPTRCGIATFSAALVGALRAQEATRDVGIMALGDATVRPGGEIIGRLVRGGERDLDRAAVALRAFDVVIVQHEYGIYPGADGVAVVGLLDRLNRMDRPVITVLHTVLEHPTPSQRTVLEQVLDRSAATVVMAAVARDRLLARYAVDGARIHVIPHGASVPLDILPDRADDRPTLLTWGLLGPGKGVEVAIDALAQLRGIEPRPRYIVAGETHPKVRELHGESYRGMLVARARDRGVAAQVEFVDRYLDRQALTALIRQADVVVLPYESHEQVTSGVLVDAVACGRPVVASAFPHAVELLGRGAGITVPHNDAAALATALRSVLDEPATAATLRDAARDIAPELSWNSVAQRYLQLARGLMRITRVGERGITAVAARS
jgi:glycosyltransferase involved in cell wall biosynthesis